MWRSGWMSLNKNYTDGTVDDWSKLLTLESAVVAEHQTGLGHVNDLSELNCPVVGRRRFFSK